MKSLIFAMSLLCASSAFADVNPCAGSVVTCFVSQDEKNETFPGADSCKTYFDSGSEKNVTYAYCSIPSVNSNPCAASVVTCFVSQDERNESFPGADTCKTYFDSGTEKNVTYAYCAAGVSSSPCVADVVTCFVSQDEKNETFPGADSCKTYFDSGAEKNITYAYCSK